MSALDRARAALAGTIAEIKEARRAATAELISFKAGEKLMAARATELETSAADWERRAEQAVLAGDDALAQQALQRRAEVLAELARTRADRDEQARYAVELLRSRRELDAKLQHLELREGSIAAGIAAARSGGETPFATEGGAWDRLEEAERKIDDEAIAAELDLEGETSAEGPAPAAADADDALAALKRKMKGE